MENSLKTQSSNQKIIRANQISYLLISFNVGLCDITSLATNYLYKDRFKITPSYLTQLQAITVLPWVLKPIFGILIDFFPFFGYRRKIYLLLTGIVNSICWLFMGFCAHSISNIVVLQTIVNSTLSLSTVIGQATVVELSKIKGNNSKNLISLYTFFKFVGVFASSILKGYLLEWFSIQFVFLVASGIPLTLVISGFILKEKKHTHHFDEKNYDDKNEQLVKKNSSKSEDTNKVSLCKKLILFYFQKRIIIPTIFIIFLLMCPPSYDKQMFYYNSEKLHFTPKNFGLIFLISTVASLITIQIYKRCLVKIEFLYIICFARIGYFIGVVLNYLIIERYNIKYGVSDYISSILSGIIQNSMRELTLLPVFSLAVSLCPRDLEGTIYSIFMSSITLGTQFGALTGSFISSYLGITKENYDNLGFYLKILSLFTLIPLLILFLLPKLYFNVEKQEKAEKGKELEELKENKNEKKV